MATPPVLLFAFANDKEKSLRLTREARELKKLLQRMHDQERIELEFLPNAQVEDIYDTFDRLHGRIVLFHYAGHSDSDFIALENGRSDAHNLSELMGQEKALQLVFLNGCANRGQVDKLFSNGIKAVVATESNISDEAAIQFSQRFYNALAQGKSIKNAFGSARSFLADKQLDGGELQEGTSWRSLGAGQERGLAPRENTQRLPWGLYHNGQPAVLDWRLPKNNDKWKYAVIAASFLVLLFVGWYILFRINPPNPSASGSIPATVKETPLCPVFTDSATFRVAIFPFDAGYLKPEQEIAEALNRLNREHRSSHPGRNLFYAEAAVSHKKTEQVNESAIDSMLKVCQADMAIWGRAYESHSGQPFGLKLNTRSTKTVAIDGEASLPYDDNDGFAFLDTLENQSAFIFALIDGHFHCFSQPLAQEMERRIGGTDSAADTAAVSRLRIASFYYIINDRPAEAIGLLNRNSRLTSTSPALVRNLGLCYVETQDYKQASKTLQRLPASSLSRDLLMFRWKVHRRAGYYKPALEDIDRLLNMGVLDGAQQSQLEQEKSAMEHVLEKARLEKEMKQRFDSRLWAQAIETAGELLKLDDKHLRAIEVSMESYNNLAMSKKKMAAPAQKAMEYANMAIGLQPKHFRAHYILMGLQAETGQWAAAIKTARQVLSLNAKTYRAYEVLIVSNLKLNNSNDACTALKQSDGKVSADEYKRLAGICGNCCLPGIFK